MTRKRRSGSRGSIELVVFGLLAALLVVLAIPLLFGVPKQDLPKPHIHALPTQTAAPAATH